VGAKVSAWKKKFESLEQIIEQTPEK